ncbi:hypothetical protein JZ751_026255 [Albula glossodonta]|uniref:Uncharacterized protein n=1 Tax=Albula glossodonta TaxID=121402 RepID=A0A8T2PJS4_9TELE|nr:hypothetical protein JZ751_026255 [Albula glossodonta]
MCVIAVGGRAIRRRWQSSHSRQSSFHSRSQPFTLSAETVVRLPLHCGLPWSYCYRQFVKSPSFQNRERAKNHASLQTRTYRLAGRAICPLALCLQLRKDFQQSCREQPFSPSVSITLVITVCTGGRAKYTGNTSLSLHRVTSAGAGTWQHICGILGSYRLAGGIV